MDTEATEEIFIHGARQPKAAERHHFVHYVVVRTDLPRGAVAAHIVHAAGESASGTGWRLPDDTRAVVLGVANEGELLDVLTKVISSGRSHVAITETSGGFAGQTMAIGVVPGPWGRLECLSHLGLYR